MAIKRTGRGGNRLLETIRKTVQDGLCTGCGTCIGVCPTSAIRMIEVNGVYTPFIQKNCVQCGLCVKVCPGCSVDFEELNKFFLGKKKNDWLVGNYFGCYTGHATDYNIRFSSSSGGLVTALLVLALNEHFIDGAVVTKMSSLNPLRPEVFIAKTTDEIVNASGSKYCPVPVNAIISKLLKQDGKYAVVGLPCHIEGLRKAEFINQKLAEKIFLHFGLICNHTPTFSATDYLIRKTGAAKENVARLDYRGSGWPGSMSINLISGEKKLVKQFDCHYWGHAFQFYFCSPRCLLCCDKPCTLSDIAFGDAWNLSSDKIGESIVITRNNIADELLQEAVKHKKITLKHVSSRDVIVSQALSMVRKRQTARMAVFKKLGKEVPLFNQRTLKPTVADYVEALRAYLRWSISSRRQLEKLTDAFIHLC